MSTKASANTYRNIFTDYDDTLVCSCAGPPSIAGSDTSYPPHTPYPGMSELLRQLIATPYNNRGTSHTKRKRPHSSGATVYISTARPNVPGLRKDPSELQRILQLPQKPILLYGDAYVGTQWVASRLLDHTLGEKITPSKGSILSSPSSDKHTHSNKFKTLVKRQLGHTKYTSWVRANGPNGPSVFLGDSGQGDIYAALEMLQHMLPQLADYRRARTRKHSAQRAPLFRAYIHLIDTPSHRRTKQLPFEYTLSPIARRHICVYRTTEEAAMDAHRHGLIRASGLKTIQNAYRAAVRKTPCMFKATDTHTQKECWWTFVPNPTKHMLGYLHEGQLGASAHHRPLASPDSIVVPRYPFRSPSRKTLAYTTFERSGQLRYIRPNGATDKRKSTRLPDEQTGEKLCRIHPMLNRRVLGDCLRAL